MSARGWGRKVPRCVEVHPRLFTVQCLKHRGHDGEHSARFNHRDYRWI